MGFIYKITNKVNGKQYIGKTQKSIEERFKDHVSEINKARVEKRPLYAAMRKYGVENFQIELLEEADNSILGEREVYWIEHFGTYGKQYNATRGGDGKPFYDTERILNELVLCGSTSDVARRIGCCVETAQSVAKEYGIKTYGSADKTRDEKQRMVICEADDCVVVFRSVSSAARWLLEINAVDRLSSSVRTHISECARGIRKTAYGYKWYYA